LYLFNNSLAWYSCKFIEKIFAKILSKKLIVPSLAQQVKA